LKIFQNVSLKNFTTLRVGGLADFFVKITNRDELQKSLDFAREQNLPIFILGGGSNLLFSDNGFRGLVIKNEIQGIQFEKNIVKVGSGVLLSNLITESAKKNLTGLENLAGIPGTVGGAVIGNANNIGEKVLRVGIFDNDKQNILKKQNLKFSYRDSNLRDKIIIKVEFELQKSNEDLVSKIAKIVKEKITKQPYKNTAGSWFKNPSEAELQKAGLAKKLAWELIDESGCRGLRVGDAIVSKKHANFFQNTGNARVQDFLELEKLVAKKVAEKFGVKLKREVIVG
jgi:UDP-N-acetylmuramate dehydrogenase